VIAFIAIALLKEVPLGTVSGVEAAAQGSDVPLPELEPESEPEMALR
jgi:hypothetical protein